MASSKSQRYFAEIGSFSGRSECLGRQSQSGQNKTNRVVPEQCNSAQVVSNMGNPLIDLFVSEDNKKTPMFCTWFPSHSALTIDALSIALGEHGSISISFDLSFAKRLSTHEEISLPDNSDYTRVATKKSVHQSAAALGGMSGKTVGNTRSVDSSENKNISTQPTDF